MKMKYFHNPETSSEADESAHKLMIYVDEMGDEFFKQQSKLNWKRLKEMMITHELYMPDKQIDETMKLLNGVYMIAHYESKHGRLVGI